MIADKNFYDICFTFFCPTASATVYGQRPKFFKAEHSATAEGKNCAYGPTLGKKANDDWVFVLNFSSIVPPDGRQTLHLYQLLLKSLCLSNFFLQCSSM